MLFGHQDTIQPNTPADSAVSPTGMTGMPQDTAPQVAPALQDPVQQAPAPSANPLAADPDTGISFPATTGDMPHNSEPQTSVLNQPSAPGYGMGAPVDNDPAPSSPFGSPQAQQASSPSLDAPDAASQGAPMAHLTPAFSEESAAAATAPEPPAAPDPTPQPVQTAPVPSPSFADYSAAQPSIAGDTSVVSSDELIELKRQALTDLGPLVDDLEQTPEEKFRTTMMLIQSTDNAGLLKAAYETAHAIPDEKARAQALLDVVNEINYFTQQSSPEPQQPVTDISTM